MVVVVFVAIRLLDRPSAFYYARVVDDHTVVIGTVSGPGVWTRVTSVQETSDRASSASAP